jgi:peroxidase
VVDNEFYKQLLLKRGIMHIDQELAIDSSTSGFVSRFARDGNGFKQSFGKAMVKMGSVGVLVGNGGEVRKNCRVFNPKNKPTVPSPPKKDKVSPPSKKANNKKQKKPKGNGKKNKNTRAL